MGRLRVRGDAATELIGLLSPVEEQDISDLLNKVLPCLVPLIVIKPEDAISLEVESNPEMRRATLCLLHKLASDKRYQTDVCKMISDGYIGKELLLLLNKVNNSRNTKGKSGKKAIAQPAEAEADFDPLDEEVSRYVVNLVNMCRLSKVPGFESRKADAEDNELIDHDINLDPAVRQRLEAGQSAALNQNKMESAYEQMQNQLGQIEAEQLHSSGGGNEKKVFKVVVVGDAGVGKSSIIHRYIEQKPPPKVPTPTLGCEYNSKRIERPGVTVLLQLFDIQGLENFRKAAPRAFFANAHGCIVCFDSDAKRAASFYGAQEWKKTVDMHFEEGNRKGAPAIMIANKSDLPNSEKNPFVRSAAKMERCIAENGFISWHETSARDGKGLKTANGATTAIDSLIDSLLLWDKQGKFVTSIEEDTVALDGKNSSSGCSC